MKLSDKDGPIPEEDGSNPFGDDDDVALCEIADALEDSMEVFGDELFPVSKLAGQADEDEEEDQSIPIENRFKTRVGEWNHVRVAWVFHTLLNKMNLTIY